MRKRPVIAGLIAGDALLLLFIALVTAISGWSAVTAQFGRYWYFIVALAAGFGVQVGLYVHLRESIARRASGKVVAVSGSTSAAAMISCCAHYLVNILPVIGVSGIAAFIGQYQTQLFWVGLAANAAGIAYIARQIRRLKRIHGFPAPARPTANAPAPLINHFIVLVAFVLIVVGTILLTNREATNNATAVTSGTRAPTSTTAASGLATQTDGQGQMTVAVTPKRDGNGSWAFTVQIDNHVTNVMQDMVAVSTLTDQSGVAYNASAWTGDPPGGHHRQGTLTFNGVPDDVTGLTLTIRDLGGIAERTFRWTDVSSTN